MTDNETAERIIGILSSRNFHQHGKGKNPPKPGTAGYNFFLKIVKKKAKDQKPVKFFINFSGHKNLNACRRPEPDESETRALTLLAEMAKQIEGIYPKGVIINIIVNDARAAFANGAKLENAGRYFAGIEKMILEKKDFSRHFRLFRLKDIWEKEGKEFFSLLEQNVREIAETIESDLDLPELVDRARRSAKPGTPDHELKQAVVRFKATLATEKELRIWEKHFPQTIMLSYRVNPAWGIPFFLPWATGKGETTQPWHGPYDPITKRVMTAARQELQKTAFRWI